MPRLKGHIQRRANTWYATLDVPKDVRKKLRKVRFIQSLQTDSHSEALRRAAPLVAAWKGQIEASRGSSYARVKSDSEFFRRALGPGASKVNVAAIAELRSSLALCQTEEEREEILDLIEELADNIAPTSEDNPEGDDPAALALAKRVYGLASGATTPTDQHLDEWIKGLPDEAKTKDLKRVAVSSLADRFPALSDISRKAVQKYCLKLIQEKGLARATVNRNLSAWRKYWSYLQALEIASDELTPFSGLSLPGSSKKAVKAGERRPFKPAEVVMLLGEAEKRGDKELADMIRLGMWTGARIEELASLSIDRVNLGEGYIDIADAKTPAGWRQVPIHKEVKPTLERLCGNRKEGYVLVRLGKYKTKNRDGKNKYGDRGNAVGKRFGRLKADLGFGRSHVFHSIRRTVITTLENAGVPENVVADIVGHKKKTMTYGLYSGGTELKVKAKAIEKLKYPTSPA
jgi:integrase